MANVKKLDNQKDSLDFIKQKAFKYTRFEKRDFTFIYLLIAFPVVQFIIFWVYVNFSSITMAFQSRIGAATFNNIKSVYNAFITSDIYGFNLTKSLMRSMTLWGLSNIICFPIGILTTYVLYKRVFGHYVWRVCHIIPSLMGAVVWTTLIRYMVSYDGAVTELLKYLGADLPEEALRNGLFGSEKTAFPTLLWLQFIMGIVGTSVVLTGAYSRIPDEIHESAELDGASFWRECFSIAIPMIWPTIATLMTFNLTGIFTADANVFLYSQGTGEPGMSTIGFQLYFLTYKISLAEGGARAYGYPAALGLVLTLLTLPIVLIGRYLLEKREAVEY